MKAQEVEKFVREHSKNNIFGMTFTYRDNPRNRKLKRVGQERHITCRLGVAKYVQGIELDRKEKDQKLNLLTVYEMIGDSGDEHYRRIPLENVKSIRLNGRDYEIE